MDMTALRTVTHVGAVVMTGRAARHDHPRPCPWSAQGSLFERSGNNGLEPCNGEVNKSIFTPWRPLLLDMAFEVRRSDSCAGWAISGQARDCSAASHEGLAASVSVSRFRTARLAVPVLKRHQNSRCGGWNDELVRREWTATFPESAAARMHTASSSGTAGDALPRSTQQQAKQRRRGRTLFRRTSGDQSVRRRVRATDSENGDSQTSRSSLAPFNACPSHLGPRARRKRR
ncbi:hypothetical protein BDV95DRAFT_69329 [Massariosphaeria phaeospora]|uniref:Uncharacterized protein n=1 Tax=Massariosphaeria phaeospora TaxID=100035 RepID=A0A7C8IE26_9PLEO|nr:hypothetical protein BDV95DRAFT_69329 [Massariosphaeria phaeospora]